MSNAIVIDHTVIEQINLGNADAAAALKQHRDARGEIWMTNEIYRMLARVQANERLIKDLNIRFPEKDVLIHRDQRQLYGSHLSENSAALAQSKKARVMTADANFANMFRGLGGQSIVVNTANARGNLDFNRARGYFGLPKLNLTPNGQLSTVRTPGTIKTNSTSQPLVKADPKAVIKDGNKTTPVVPKSDVQRNGRTGSPVKPVVEHGLKPSPKTDAVRMSLRGVNWVIQGINDHIQQGRIEERMKQILPTIEETLDRDPTLGVLIVTVFSQRQKVGAEHDSPLEHTKGFQYVDYEYGRTQEEAQGKMARQAKMQPAGAGQLVSQKQWIPPQQAPSAKDLPTPFGRSALATFYPGLEELVAVNFSFALGFDDKMKSRIRLNDPQQRARFIVMFPPNEIQFFDNGRWRTYSTQVAGERPKQIWHAELGAYYVPVLELDSSINPWDATAAMVYPADDYTMKLFQPQGRISDGGLLRNYSMDLVRFVKPHKMSVIQDFSQMSFSGT
jgi:hypothetical protein